MSILYKCNKCGVTDEAVCGKLRNDWGYAGNSDLCPKCLPSYRELEKAHAETWREKLEAWFKEK